MPVSNDFRIISDNPAVGYQKKYTQFCAINFEIYKMPLNALIQVLFANSLLIIFTMVEGNFEL